MILDELIAFPVVAILFAVLLSMLLCMAYGRRWRPSFWLCPLIALGTGIFMFIGFAGNRIIKHDFWAGDGNTSPTGTDMLPYFLGISGLSAYFRRWV